MPNEWLVTSDDVPNTVLTSEQALEVHKMIVDKHTLRAKALAAMRAAVACDWAKVILNTELQKQEVGSALYGEYHSACDLAVMQVDDELSKCHEALNAYYHNPNVRTT